MAGRGSVTHVTDSREHVRACTGRAMEENHRKWFSSQALSQPDQPRKRLAIASRENSANPTPNTKPPMCAHHT